MPTRVLDWNGLVRVAERRSAADRLVTVAGLSARVIPSRGTDVGFYVRTADEDLGPSEAWTLRAADELALLRQLVDRRLVTVDDDEDVWRIEEWQRLTRFIADPRCFVYGCENTEIDQRGPVFDRDKRMHLACTPHWEGVYGPLGEQAAEHADVVEIRSWGSEEPVRAACVVCGAGADTAHDPDAHMTEAARETQRGGAKDRP